MQCHLEMLPHGFEHTVNSQQAARALADLDERQWAAQGLLGSWHPLRLEQLNHRIVRQAFSAALCRAPCMLRLEQRTCCS